MLIPPHLEEMVSQLAYVKDKIFKITLGTYPRTYRIMEDIGGGVTRQYGPQMDAFELYEMLQSTLAPNGTHHEDEDEEPPVTGSNGLH